MRVPLIFLSLDTRFGVKMTFYLKKTISAPTPGTVTTVTMISLCKKAASCFFKQIQEKCPIPYSVFYHSELSAS